VDHFQKFIHSWDTPGPLVHAGSSCVQPNTPILKSFEEGTLDEFDRMIDLNLRGILIATEAALLHLKSGGRIINIGSCVGEPMTTPGLAVYSATKGAVKMFLQGLSGELGGGAITVNNVRPGPIDTDLNPAAGDWATPQRAATARDREFSLPRISGPITGV
jgi:3-oxoacyl-[acyl-carrier protein] reductase